MKNLSKNILFAGLLVLGLNASAQNYEYADHTENAEVVCQMDDFVATKLYVDWDEDFDGATGKNSSKVLEVPTQHVFGNSGLLYLVKVVKVEHPSCYGCEDSEVIYYRSQFTPDIINKLEVSSSEAKLTIDVDAKGQPKRNAIVSHGRCQLNEVE